MFPKYFYKFSKQEHFSHDTWIGSEGAVSMVCIFSRFGFLSVRQFKTKMIICVGVDQGKKFIQIHIRKSYSVKYVITNIGI